MKEFNRVCEWLERNFPNSSYPKKKDVEYNIKDVLVGYESRFWNLEGDNIFRGLYMIDYDLNSISFVPNNSHDDCKDGDISTSPTYVTYEMCRLLKNLNADVISIDVSKLKKVSLKKCVGYRDGVTVYNCGDDSLIDDYYFKVLDVVWFYYNPCNLAYDLRYEMKNKNGREVHYWTLSIRKKK